MADISKIKVQGTTYDVKDVKARSLAMHSVLPLVDVVEEQAGDVFEMTAMATGIARDVYYVKREDTDAAPSGFYLKSVGSDGTYYKHWKEGAVPSSDRYEGAANSNLYIKDGALYRLQGDSLTPVMGGGGGGELGEDVVISKGSDGAYNFGNEASIGAGAIMGKDAKVGAGVALDGASGGFVVSSQNQEMVALGGKNKASGEVVKVAIGTIIPGGGAVSDADVVIGKGVKIGEGSQIGGNVRLSEKLNISATQYGPKTNLVFGTDRNIAELSEGSRLGTGVKIESLKPDGYAAHLYLGTGELRTDILDGGKNAVVIKNNRSQSSFDASIVFFENSVRFGTGIHDDNYGMHLAFGTDATTYLTIDENYLAIGTGAMGNDVQNFTGLSIEKAGDIRSTSQIRLILGTGALEVKSGNNSFGFSIKAADRCVRLACDDGYVDIPLINGTLGAEVANEVMEVD